jgi:hypothetical protein
VTRSGEFSPIGQLLILGSFFNYRSSGSFSIVQVVYRFWQHTGWATFWANFLQTRQVTLVQSKNGTICLLCSVFWRLSKTVYSSFTSSNINQFRKKNCSDGDGFSTFWWLP